MLTISGREPTLLRISDKLSLRYVKLGEGPALVLLHGWPLTSAVWQPVIEPLAADHHVLAFDLPGIGQSASPIQAPTRKEEIAQLVIGAAQAAGAHHITVAGVDVGGMVAFAAARDFADRIRGAVGSDPGHVAGAE